MNSTFLLIATILLWTAVVTGCWQQVLRMPRWFENASEPELIRQEDRRELYFWVTLAILFLISIIGGLILNWKSMGARVHIICAFLCFAVAAVSNGIYFVEQNKVFREMKYREWELPLLTIRTRKWLLWTSIRNILLIFAALFVTIAYRHA